MKIIVLSAAVAFVAATAPAAADPLRPLRPADAAVYTQAFAAVKANDFATLPARLRRLKDPCLAGRLEYIALMRPDFEASATELAHWLKRHAREPDADKIFALARRRAAAGGGVDAGAVGAIALTKPAPQTDAALAASRESYYKAGDLKTALKLAETSGERWIAGLSAYRLDRFALAKARFESLAADPAQSDARRSGAAFWAARAALASGNASEASGFLQLAAKAPLTFYGQIAVRRLAAASSPDAGSSTSTPAAPLKTTSVERSDASAKALGVLVRHDPRARRAAAFAQIGDIADAQRELKAALFGAGSAYERELWRSLAIHLGAQTLKVAPAAEVDPDAYPRPSLTPVGGFTVDPALVYAIIRQESGFNTAAASAEGAFGLMQLTAASAALDAGVSPNQMDVGLLLDADTNVRLGQDHLTHLLSLLGHDLLQTVMAYNAGSKPVTRLSAAMPGADGLLLLESLPGAETRDFAQKVLSNYWIYQRLMDHETPTLDALAEGRPSLLAPEMPTNLAPTNPVADGQSIPAGLSSSGGGSV